MHRPGQLVNNTGHDSYLIFRVAFSVFHLISSLTHSQNMNQS